MSSKSLKDQLLNLGFKASDQKEVKPEPRRSFLNVNSFHWNWEIGVCEKHLLPSVPCPACLENDDEGLFEDASSIDRMLWDNLDCYNNNS